MSSLRYRSASTRRERSVKRSAHLAAAASIVAGFLVAYYTQQLQAGLLGLELTPPAPLQVRVAIAVPPLKKEDIAPTRPSAVLPIQSPVAHPVALKTKVEPPPPPLEPSVKKEQPPSPPEEPPKVVPKEANGKFTTSASLESTPEGLKQANPETTPNNDSAVIEITINDRGVVVGSRVKVVSSHPLEDTTLALVAMGQFYGVPVPPLLPGQTRVIDMPIYYGKAKKPVTPESSPSSTLP